MFVMYVGAIGENPYKRVAGFAQTHIM